jgi:DNA-binding GntR family transcriptional regulator
MEWKAMLNQDNNLEQMLTTKIQTSSLQELVYDRVRQLILTNRLKPGQTINIAQLAAELGVSQTPTREALAMLKLEGLVTFGYYQAPQVSKIEEADVISTYEMRIVLEGWAVRHAATAIPTSTVERIIALHEQVRAELKQQKFDNYLKADLMFHGEIAASVSNQLFARLYGIVDGNSLRIRTLVEAHSTAFMEGVVDEHEAVLDGLLCRDPDLAERELVIHLNNAMERALRVVR